MVNPIDVNGVFGSSRLGEISWSPNILEKKLQKNILSKYCIFLGAAGADAVKAGKFEVKINWFQ